MCLSGHRWMPADARGCPLEPANCCCTALDSSSARRPPSAPAPANQRPPPAQHPAPSTHSPTPARHSPSSQPGQSPLSRPPSSTHHCHSPKLANSIDRPRPRQRRRLAIPTSRPFVSCRRPPSIGRLSVLSRPTASCSSVCCWPRPCWSAPFIRHDEFPRRQRCVARGHAGAHPAGAP